MNRFLRKSISNICLLLIFSGYSTGIIGQVSKNQVIEKSFANKNSVRIGHKYGPIKVMKASDGTVKCVVTLSFKAKNEKDADILLEHFDLDISQGGQNVEVLTDFGIEQWNTINNQTTIKFKDGKKVKDIKDVKIEMLVYIPKLTVLELENKYDKITIEDPIETDLKLKLHSGRFEINDVKGKLTSNLKYSKGSFGNFEDGELELYECKVEFGSGKAVNCKSKYSDLMFGDLSSLKLDAYDDKIKVGGIQGDFVINGKYSDFTVKRCGNAWMDIYDSNLILNKGQDVIIKSKYSNLNVGTLKSISFELSYEDNFSIQELEQLVANSKYSNFSIEVLERKLSCSSYSDDIHVGQVKGSLEGISFNGKYTDLELNLPNDIKFQMEATIKYGKLHYPKERFQTDIYKEKNENLEIKGKTKGATGEAPLIKIQAYDGKIELK